MSDCHGSPHRTATPSEEKARCNKAFLQIDDESQKQSLYVCRVPKSGAISLIPPKTQGVATQILMSDCGAFENFMKERGNHS